MTFGQSAYSNIVRRCGKMIWYPYLAAYQRTDCDSEGRRKSKAMIQDRTPGKNWAGNYTYRAHKLHRPSTIEQLQEIIANAPRVRVLGSRHSFNDIADSSELITLDTMPMDVFVDHAADTVSFNAALKYGELVEKLNEEGVALH